MTSSIPHRRVSLLVALLAALLAAAMLSASPASAARACQSASASPASASKRSVVRATLCLLNNERSKRGLRRLRLSKRLSRAASRHARDMARRKYFSHQSFSGADFVQRIRRTGYLHSARSWSVGENIAWGTESSATPSSIMKAWMNSPGHKANIVSRSFTEIGIGVASRAPVWTRGSGGTYATDFGKRR